MSENVKKELNMIKKVGAGLLILFLVITFIYLIKIANGDTCGRETYTDYGFGGLQAAYNITTGGEIILQHNPYDRQKNIEQWRFCFTNNATAGIRMFIVNEAEDVLGQAIIESGYDTHCYNIVFPENETYNYIGFRCDDCGTVANVTIYEEILGVDVERVLITGSVFLTPTGNTLDFVLEGAPSCWENIKYFTFWYLTSLILLLLVAGAFVGKDKLRELLEN